MQSAARHKLANTLRLFAATFALIAVAAALPGLAGAATQLGDNAPAPSTDSSCINCSFLQYADNGSPAYSAGQTSVVTEFGFREGSTFGLNNSFTLQIWRPEAGGTFRLVDESLPLYTFNLGNYLRFGYVRMSMQAGDVIGTRVNTPGGDTDPVVPAAAGFTAASIVGNPAIGDSFTPIPFGSSRLNLYAIIEPDADGDGYGDESQDLCLGNPTVAITACSGTRIGPELTNRSNGGQGCGAPDCLVVSTGVAAGTASSPIDGVIVRWRFKTDGSGGNYRLRTARRATGDDITTLRSSPDLASTVGFNQLQRSGEVRVPVSAGDLIGLQTPNGVGIRFTTFDGMSASFFDQAVPDGSTATPPITWGSSTPMVSADVEPDADGDGFGDITQDLCPSQSQTQGACLPLITNVKVSRAKFRVNVKGGKKSKTGKGTTLSFDSAAAGTMTVAIQQVVRGKARGSKCVRATKRNRRKKNCNRYVKVHEIKSSVAAATNALAYTGRYKRSRKIRSLKPGKYRFSIVTRNAAGSDAATSRIVRVVKR